jgi:uncharacterized protein
MNQPNLRLLILSDGREGHVSTSRGMAELINSAWPCTIEQMEVRLRAKFLRPLLKWLLNSGRACRLLAHPSIYRWPSLFYRGYDERAADVIISAGGDTLYLNALLGHCLGKANFFCGSMRGVRPDLYQLIIHIRPSELTNWIAMEVLPSSAQMDAATLVAQEFSHLKLSDRVTGFWTLMIGGNGGGYRFSADDILALLQHCCDLAQQHGKTMLISTSRRTGEKTEERILDWLTAHPEAPVAYTVLYNHKPERVATALMSLAEVVICTEDSISMISESVILQRPVISIGNNTATPSRDHDQFLHRLGHKKRIFRQTINTLDKLNIAVLLKSWRAYDHTDRKQLRQRMLAVVNKLTGQV